MNSEEKLKILFLGIDGVVNHLGMLDTVENDTLQVSESNISLLNKLIKEQNLKVVVMGSLRYHKTAPLLSVNIAQRLSNLGLTCKILGSTPMISAPHCYRGNEVDAWLIRRLGMYTSIPKTKYDDYIIVNHTPNVFLTSQLDKLTNTGDQGFDQVAYKKVLEILNKQNKEV